MNLQDFFPTNLSRSPKHFTHNFRNQHTIVCKSLSKESPGQNVLHCWKDSWFEVCKFQRKASRISVPFIQGFTVSAQSRRDYRPNTTCPVVSEAATTGRGALASAAHAWSLSIGTVNAALPIHTHPQLNLKCMPRSSPEARPLSELEQLLHLSTQGINNGLPDWIEHH